VVGRLVLQIKRRALEIGPREKEAEEKEKTVGKRTIKKEGYSCHCHNKPGRKKETKTLKKKAGSIGGGGLQEV